MYRALPLLRASRSQGMLWPVENMGTWVNKSLRPYSHKDAAITPSRLGAADYSLSMSTTSDRPIEEYALIGNCETAALINADGGIDWLCLPAFDGPSLFGALLDREKGGDFTVRPSVPYRVKRGYLDDSAVFETRFITAQGAVKLTDFFVIARRRDARGYDFTALYPTRKLVRIVELESGSPVPMEMSIRARPNYGSGLPHWARTSATGITCGHATIFTNTAVSEDGPNLKCEWDAAEGECYFAVLDYGEEQPIPDVARINEWRRVTATFWKHWNYFNNYGGPHQRAIRRSAVTLKLLTYAPTGAFVAAPTTSLPEIEGGDANWDYRYTWVRDTSLFIITLFRLGYSGEASAFLDFVTRLAMQRTKDGCDALPVLYGVREDSCAEEQELPHLSGWRGSQPVRIGNRAASQFQIDNFAHILEALAFFKYTGGHIGSDKMKLVQQTAAEIVQRWREPDNGIWEEQERQQYTYGKVAAWASLMRADGLADLMDVDVAGAIAEIKGEVFNHALRGDEDGRHMVSRFDTNDVDASCLLAFVNGIIPKTIARATRERIEAGLGDGPFLYRNPEHKEKGEGAFFLCMFWRISHLVQEGEQARAEELLEQVLAMQNPFGLLAEEIDPKSGHFLGNFPQAFSHLGLIAAVLNVEQAKLDPESHALTEHDKFLRTVGLTRGLRAIVIGFFRAPKTIRLFLRSGGSKWKG